MVRYWILWSQKDYIGVGPWRPGERMHSNIPVRIVLPAYLAQSLSFREEKAVCSGGLTQNVTTEIGRWEGYIDGYKILLNDWPYGTEQDIIHLVVWTKFELEDDPAMDDLTPRAFTEIDDFVETVFRSKMPAGEVRGMPSPSLLPLPVERLPFFLFYAVCKLT